MSGSKKRKRNDVSKQEGKSASASSAAKSASAVKMALHEKVLVRDKMGMWEPAQIVEVKSKKVKVHFLKWWDCSHTLYDALKFT